MSSFQDFAFAHLSAGDLLREERQTPGSQYGELIEHHIVSGTIVPVEITCSLIDVAIKKRMSGGDGISRFLVDGFPRNQDNYDGWERQMADKVDFKFVLYFDCPDEVAIKRCLNRGAAGSGRSDDCEEILRKRMNTFYQDTWPIIECYASKDQVRTIDATKDPDGVYEEVKKVFKEFTV